jgi:Tol biopolymer transport system component
MNVNHDKIRAQLERLAASPEFSRTYRMARFLRLVVEKTLVGDTAALRERQIGVDVFDRPQDWDPKLDNTVRSEARRLRAKLDLYAESASPDETVRITMPKGGYAASFQDLAPETVVHLPNDARLPAATLHRPLIEWKSTLLLAMSMAVTVASVFLFSVWHRRAVQAKTENFEIVPFSTEIGQQFSPSISPDGTRIAFVWNGDGAHFNIYIKPVAGGAPVQLTKGTTPDLHPFWSPDGSKIAFLRESSAETDLIVKNLAGGTERILRRMRDPLALWSSVNTFSGCQSPSWTSDGKQIVLTDALSRDKGSGLVSISSTTGEEKVTTSPPGEDQDCYSRVSPDGKTIAFVRYLSHWVGDIYTMDGDGGNLKRVTFDSRDVRGLDWTSDGRQIVFASRLRGAYELRVIGRNGGASTLVPTDTASIADPTVSSKGRFIAFVESEENWNIWRASIKDGQVGKAERFLASSGQNHSPSYSPDGKTIAYVSDRSGNPEIWFSDSDGSNLRQRTHFGGPWLGTIRWAPDGSTIVFDARPHGHSAVFTMAVAGGEPKPFQREDFEVRRPSWSRDGKSIYFDSTRGGRPGIWKRNLASGETSSIAPAGSLQSLEALDGSQLFFAQTETHDLWMSNTDGSNAIKLDAMRPNPDLDWTLGPGDLYYVASRGSLTDVFAYHLANRQLKNIGQLTQTLSPGTPSLAVSPDGRWLLYAVIDHIKSDIKLRKDEMMTEARK